jgi:hypothetical protein
VVKTEKRRGLLADPFTQSSQRGVTQAIHRDRSRLALGFGALIASSFSPTRLTDAIPGARTATNQRPKPSQAVSVSPLTPVTARSFGRLAIQLPRHFSQPSGSRKRPHPPTFVASLAFTHSKPPVLASSSKPRGLRPSLVICPPVAFGRCHIHPERTHNHPFEAVSRPTHTRARPLIHLRSQRCGQTDNKSHIWVDSLPSLLSQLKYT